MAQSEKRFTGKQRCEHCANIAPMEIVAQYSGIKSHQDHPHGGFTWEEGTVYDLLLCPACEGVSLHSYYCHDAMDQEDLCYRTLYPTPSKHPVGLPDSIIRAYDAAQKVRSIDANAYGVLLGRLLELVCQDRNASGRVLGDKLKDLASRGEIPDKLVGVADGLKDLRNVGAHPTLGELTTADLPIMDSLCRAVLEYVYSAPFLAKEAETCFKQLKSASTRGSDGDAKAM